MTLEQAVQLLLFFTTKAALLKDDHVRCEQAAKLLLDHFKKDEKKEPENGSEASK